MVSQFAYPLQRNAPIGVAGWFAPQNRAKLADLIEEHDIRSVVEIGSFLGLSAIWFAQRVDSVCCIDSWYEGNTYESNNNLVGTLRRWELPRDFFGIFRDNVMRSGHWHQITPIRGHSHYVAEQAPFADLVYIDGDHSFEGCAKDIEIYRDKARVIICGDDFVEREGFGVIEAVTELLPNHQHSGAFWWADLSKQR